MISNKDDFHKARDYAFLLLKFRLRSENELLGRLKRKGFAAGTAARVLSFLKEKGFIDDNYFAGQWIKSRLSKPFGLRRLESELRAKGISCQIISDHLAGLRQDYDEGPGVLGVAREKLKKMAGLDSQKARRRLYGWFLRRGFSPETVGEVLRKL